MDQQERLNYLLERYANNACSESEFNELFLLIGSTKDKAEVLNGLKEIWKHTDSTPSHSEAEWEHLYASLQENSATHPPHQWSLWKKISIAALFFTICAVGLLVYQTQSPTVKTVQVKNFKPVQALAPGGNKAVLTLSNGKKIILDGRSNGLIASQTGVSISKTAEGQLVYTLANVPSAGNEKSFNTIETPQGGQYQVTMPDGSKVWLNALSSLKYPLHFAANERKVELTGEAYFEVSKHPEAPFKVQTEQQTVEVLGTHFNINAYKNESLTRTTLLEGSVKIKPKSAGPDVLLVPGNQAALSNGNTLVKNVDTELAVAWKNGNFIFSNDDLGSIMRQLSRWYDVEIDFQNTSVKSRTFSGSISRFENASQVLDILELTGLVHFKVEGRRIIVM